MKKPNVAIRRSPQKRTVTSAESPAHGGWRETAKSLRPPSTMGGNLGIGSLPAPVHAARLARFFVGAGDLESFGRRAKTYGSKDQNYGVFAHRNPL